MSQQLPPLNALRAFESVARHRSFTKAALELNVTRAAISHQIKFLEDYLGFTLIIRGNRSITLSKGAEAALPKLRIAFDHLSEAVSLMRGTAREEKLNVWAAPSFASKWLIPRLHRFSKTYPDIDMQISGDPQLVDAEGQLYDGTIETIFRNHPVDVMIRFGSGYYKGCMIDKLLSVDAVPLCSPTLLSTNLPHPLHTPEDLRYYTLIHDNTDYTGRPSWAHWLTLHGIEGINANKGLHFNQVSLALEAAIDGQGVLLSIRDLAQLDIDAGRLIIPFEGSLPLEHSYYIVRPLSSTSNHYAVTAFVNWLHEEAKNLKSSG